MLLISNTRDGVYMITMIIKRDGRKVPFNVEKIAKAIYKAAVAVGGKDYEEAEELQQRYASMLKKHKVRNVLQLKKFKML